jgi:23S rRNA pseudouridine955/2504/2580 synthase
MQKSYNVTKDYNNSRFDKWFKLNVVDLPQSLIEKIIRLKKVKVNNKKTKSSYRLKSNDIIQVYDLTKFKPTKKKEILKYKPSKNEANKYDNYIIDNNVNFLVINKPSGIPVQAGTKAFKNMIDILKDTKFFYEHKPYIVHRLDKDTSGLLLVAKNREYAQLFTSLFRIRKIHKTYLAIVYGKIKKRKMTLIDDLIVFENGKKIIQKAITHVNLVKQSNDYSLIELNPITGRKHQLRKQLLNIGHSIIGDDKYSSIKYSQIKKNKFKPLMLHASKLKFMIKNVKYNFKANYNEQFEKFIKDNL